MSTTKRFTIEQHALLDDIAKAIAEARRDPRVWAELVDEWPWLAGLDEAVERVRMPVEQVGSR